MYVAHMSYLGVTLKHCSLETQIQLDILLTSNSLEDLSTKGGYCEPDQCPQDLGLGKALPWRLMDGHPLEPQFLHSILGCWGSQDPQLRSKPPGTR